MIIKFLLKLPIYIFLSLFSISLFISLKIPSLIMNEIAKLPSQIVSLKSATFFIIGLTSLSLFVLNFMNYILFKIFKPRNSKKGRMRLYKTNIISWSNFLIAYVAIINGYVMKVDSQILYDMTVLICIFVILQCLFSAISSDFGNLMEIIVFVSICYLNYETFFGQIVPLKYLYIKFLRNIWERI
ncbi:hypothetical protein DMUE_5176 [Dictyocoela muelleri]|nr:hypothetical protein DMUE_5176 [Dictyocoela muelleri]